MMDGPPGRQYRTAMSAPPLTAFPVTLRRWSESDAEWYAASTRDPDIQRFTTESPDLTAEQVRTAIRALLAGSDPDAGLIITDATTGERLGNIAVDSDGEVSYWVAAPARGRGVATAALRCFSDWVVATSDRPGLWLRFHSENAASAAAAVRAGYQRDPARDDQRLIKGELWTRLAYKLVRSLR
jgi:[ribosomal protein S5]-alanine N-acetyltransferase